MTYSKQGSGHIWSEATTDPLGVGELELRFRGGQFFESSTEISKVYFRAVANARTSSFKINIFLKLVFAVNLSGFRV